MLTPEQKNQILSDPLFKQMIASPQTAAPVVSSFKQRAMEARSKSVDIQKTDAWYEKYLVNPTGKAANMLFGNLGKVLGAPIVDIYNVLSSEDKGKALKQTVQTGEISKIKPSELAFAGLEAYYGEGAIATALSKIPGIKYVVKLLSTAKGAAYSKLRQKAVEMMTQALKPTTNEMKAKTARIVEETLDRGISGTSKQIKETADASKTRAWNNLDEAINAIPKDKVQSTYPIIKELAQRQKKYVVNGVIVDQNAYEAINKVGDLILQFGDEIPAADLNRVRQLLDNMTYGAGKVIGKTLKEGTEVNAQKELTDIIRREFAKENPDVALLNKEYAFWSTLDEVIGTTIKRTKPQSSMDVATAVSAGVGMASGGIDTALKAGLVTKYLGALLRSTWWKSVSAQGRKNLAEMIAAGKIEEASYYLARLYDALENKKK